MASVYTDGSSLGNPGKGGWGVLYVEEDIVRWQKSGGERSTTNNKMELRAVIEAITECRKRGIIEMTVYTDSMYVMKGITEWIKNWKKNDWKTATRKPVKNKELWVELDSVKDENVKIEWVKAHANNKYNNMVDEIARSACPVG